MSQNLARKILSPHLVSGRAIPGEEIGLAIDHVFTTDATGPLAFLAFEATGLDRVQTEVAASYVDRGNALARTEDADEQRYLASAAARFGAWHGRAGGGAGVAVHLERLAVPGKTLLGGDAHAPVCGAAGMLAVAAGPLELAAALAGAPLHLPMPRVLGVHLVGRLEPWVTAKDVGLDLLRRLTCRGGVGRAVEFHGEGLSHLTVADRAAIAAMVVESGALAVLFPADGQVRRFFEAQARVRQFVELHADTGCTYDEELEIDLGALEPLIARPGSPDDVVPVRDLAGLEVQQVVIGSHAHPGPDELHAVAALTESSPVCDRVDAIVLPASRQTLQELARSGDLGRLLGSGWRTLDPGAAPTAGIGLAPPTGGVCVRTFTRNGRGRSGTPDDQVYLASPLVAGACATTGRITDPRTLGVDPPRSEVPDRLPTDDRLLSAPVAGDAVELVRGPGIRPLFPREAPGARLEGVVVVKLGDRVSIDEILPPTPETFAARTDPLALAERAFGGAPGALGARLRSAGGGIVAAGTDFGHGSVRDLPPLALAALGIRAVVARDFARPFRMALVNHGILPLLLADPAELDRIEPGDLLEIVDLRAALQTEETATMRNVTRDTEFGVRHGLTPRQKDLLAAGGLLAWARRQTRISATGMGGAG